MLMKIQNMLTPAEMRVIRLSSTGLISNDVAIQMGVSKRTVDFHWANMMRKSKCKTALAAMLFFEVLTPTPEVKEFLDRVAKQVH